MFKWEKEDSDLDLILVSDIEEIRDNIDWLDNNPPCSTNRAVNDNPQYAVNDSSAVATNNGSEKYSHKSNAVIVYD